MKAFYRLFYYFSILLTGVLAVVTLVGTVKKGKHRHGGILLCAAVLMALFCR